MNGLAIVPPMGEEGFVALSHSKKGQVFEKHILSYGDLLYPGISGGKVTIDDSFADKMIANFNKRYCGIVQVPKADARNNHSEDPDRNIGEVIGLSKRDNKIYAQIDVRDPDAVPKMGKTYLGASAMFNLNYTDRKTMTPVGPTLVHVAVTNHPYVSDLEEYEAISLSVGNADGNGDVTGAPIFLTSANTTTEEKLDFAQIVTALRDDHNIDLPALQEQAKKADSAVALSAAIIEAFGGVETVALSADADEQGLVTAVKNAGEQIVSLSAKVAEQEKSAKDAAALNRVEGLVKSGHILPKHKDANITLLLSNPDLFEQMLPEKPLVKLSAVEDEAGFSASESSDAATAEAEIARLTALPAAKQYTA